MSGDAKRLRGALALAVGVVLADSSVVVLALPEIYRELDVSVAAVTWVLVAFNLVLALSALPAANAARRIGPARVALVGIAIFGTASFVCGLAGSIGVLLAARCVQAVGGAAAVCASLELLPSVVGSERRAATVWAASGAFGAALGPGIGGLLTELISWQSIFFVQVPIAIACGAVLLGPARLERSRERLATERERAGRPHLAANAALALVSAALAAALFLIVLLLIEGWRLSPIARRRGRHRDADLRPGRGPAGRAGELDHGPGGGGGDPGRRRPRRARAASGRLGPADAAASGPRGRRARADAVRAHRGGARRAGVAGDPRGLDDRRAPRGRGRPACWCSPLCSPPI